MSPDEMRARVGPAQVARLATVTVTGAPHLVPFCFVLDGDALYSAVDRKPKRTPRLRRLENAAAEPRVCVLVDHYEEDWSRLWWVRLDGTAAVLEPGTEVDQALGPAHRCGAVVQLGSLRGPGARERMSAVRRRPAAHR